MKLEDDLRYRKLRVQYGIANVVFVIELLNDMVKFFERESIDDLAHINLLINELEKLINRNKERLVDLSEPADYVYDFSVVDELKEDYPKETNALRLLEFQLRESLQYCKVQQPITITLMELDKLKTHFEPKDYGVASEKIAQLLKTCKYGRDAAERKYLSSNMPSLLWYNAYFFDNPSVPVKEHTFLLEELLNGALHKEGVMTGPINRAMKKHLTFDGCGISSDTISKLLDDRLISYERAYKMGKCSLESKSKNSSLQNEARIDEEFNRFMTRSTTDDEVRRLFESLMFSNSNNDWMEKFASRLVQLDNGDMIADKLFEYLRVAYSTTISARFDDAYYVAKSEMLEKRRDLCLVLREIKKKKDSDSLHN